MLSNTRHSIRGVWENKQRSTLSVAQHPEADVQPQGAITDTSLLLVILILTKRLTANFRNNDSEFLEYNLGVNKNIR